MANVGAVNNNNNKTTLCLWLGIAPQQQPSDMPQPHPVITIDPTLKDFWIPVNIIEKPQNTWFATALKYISKREYFYWVERPRSKRLFMEAMKNFIKETHVRPKYVLMYMQWWDGWQYQDYPSLFTQACREMGMIPIIRWQPSMKRKYVEVTTDEKGQRHLAKVYTFLDEFNKEMADHSSELYRHALAFGKAANSDSTPVQVSYMHEFNIDYGENYFWTLFINGGKSAASKFLTAWDNTYNVLKLDGRTKWQKLRALVHLPKKSNVSIVWCPEANPDTGNSYALAETWNAFEGLFPQGQVDVIGFDVYQKEGLSATIGPDGKTSPRVTFDTEYETDKSGRPVFVTRNSDGKNVRMPCEPIFGRAIEFTRSHPGVPVEILEASSKPEPYRVAFTRDSFRYAAENRFLCMGWFDEDKEHNWLWNAPIVDVQADNNRRLALLRKKLGLPPLPGVSLEPMDPRAGGAAFLSATRRYVESSDDRTITRRIEDFVSAAFSGAYNFATGTTPPENDVELYTASMDLKARTRSYSAAVAEERKEKVQKALSRALSKGSPFLKEISALQPMERNIALAKLFSDAWIYEPQKYNGNIGYEKATSYQIALSYLDLNITKKGVPGYEITYYTIEHVLSLIAKKDLKMKYAEIFGNLAEPRKNPKTQAEENATYDAIGEAEEVCTQILSLLDEPDFRKNVNSNRYVNNNLKRTFQEVGPLGYKASTLVSLGDIYLMRGLDATGKKRQAYIDRAEEYYRKAEAVIAEKDKISSRERYLNRSIAISRARSLALGPNATYKDLDQAVIMLSDVMNTEEKIDPILKLQASLYFAQVLCQYQVLSNKKDKAQMELGLERSRIAYQVYGTLMNTEYRGIVKKAMDGLKATLQGKKEGRKTSL